MKLCSACSGDYEDPDASVEDEPLEVQEEAGESKSDEFSERRG